MLFFLTFLAAAQAPGDQAPAQDYDWQKQQQAIWDVFVEKQAPDIISLEREKIVSLLAPKQVEPYMKYFERGLESGTGMIMVEGAEQRWLEIAFQSGFRCKRLFEQGYLEGQAAAPVTSLEACLKSGAYDGRAAENYGADEYGMKRFVLAFLKRGPKRSTDPKKTRELQTAHLKNIERMAAAGKLVLAGPFLDKGELRGIYVFNVTTVAEAETLTNSDPAIQAGSLVMEMKEWYGSAALMAVNDIHGRLSRQSISGENK